MPDGRYFGRGARLFTKPCGKTSAGMGCLREKRISFEFRSILTVACCCTEDAHTEFAGEIAGGSLRYFFYPRGTGQNAVFAGRGLSQN